MGAMLTRCGSDAALLDVNGSGEAAGTIVHRASGLCLTVGPCAQRRRPPVAAAATAAGPGRLAPPVAPCDAYGLGGTPCVAAHSVVRALYGAYAGPLYSVSRASDNATRAIGVLGPGGFADSAAQDAFCRGTDCVIDTIFDQSAHGNDLLVFRYGTRNVSRVNRAANASADPHVVRGGHRIYSLYVEPGVGYRTRPGASNGVAVGDEPESMYAVVSGWHYNDRCCFDYGNAEADGFAGAPGTMEALYIGNDSHWWRTLPAASAAAQGKGPWIMADFEDGMFAGDDFIDPDAQPRWGGTQYLTAMLKGRSCSFSLRGGPAAAGAALTTLYDGPRPQHYSYEPMQKQGSIVLGTGGDDSTGARGTFFEGAMTRGYASAAVEDEVQASIAAVGYGGGSGGAEQGQG